MRPLSERPGPTWRGFSVELTGIEPVTSSMRYKRAHRGREIDRRRGPQIGVLLHPHFHVLVPDNLLWRFQRVFTAALRFSIALRGFQFRPWAICFLGSIQSAIHSACTRTWRLHRGE